MWAGAFRAGIGRHRWAGPFRAGIDRTNRVPADDVSALRSRAVRDGVSGARDGPQQRRPQPAGLQPVHRHALLREQLSVQGPPLQLVPVREQRALRLHDERPAGSDGAQPGCRGALARRDGEVQPLHAADPGGQAPRARRAPRGARRRHQDRLSAGVSGGGDRLRRSQRPPESNRTTRSRRALVSRPRRARHPTERVVSGEGPESGGDGSVMITTTAAVSRWNAVDRSPNADETWLEGELSPHRIADDIARPLENRPTAGWWASLAASVAALALGVGMVTYQIAVGIGVWGLNNAVGWAFDITNFVFWIGIGHAGTLISAILLLFRQSWRTSVNRSAEAMTIFAVMCAALFPLIHMGRPWLAFWVLPYPNGRGSLWVNFRSPLLWDVFAINTYLTVSAVFWFLG